MKTGRKSLGGLIVIVFSLTMAIAIGSVFYYLQTKSNELSQNQLHFTELTQLSHDINNSIEQIHTVAKRITKILSDELRNRPLGDTKIDLFLDQKIKPKVDKLKRFYSRNSSMVNANIIFKKVEINEALLVGELIAKPLPVEEIVVTIVEYAKSSKSRFSLLIESPFVKITAPLEDLVNKPLQHFPIILLVSPAGQVQLTHRKNELDAYQHSLTFDNLSPILNGYLQNSARPEISLTGKKQLKHRSFGVSGYFDHTFGGEQYRIFMNPHAFGFDGLNGNDKSSDKQQVSKNLSGSYQLLGLRPAGDLSLAKLYISPTAGSLVILMLLVLIALVPLLKVRFVSSKYCFTPADAWGVAGALIVGVGLVTLILIDFTLYSDMKARVENESRYSFDKIKANFNHEIEAIKEFSKAESERQTALSKDKTETTDQFSRPLPKPFPSEENRIIGDQTKNNFVIESLFKLNGKGDMSLTVSRASALLAKNSRVNLAFRRYFKEAAKCTAWSSVKEGENDCRNQMFIERIFNVSDARLSSQFSWPLFSKLKEETDSIDEPRVLTAGVNIQSFNQPILARNISFAVFDNATGQVLYHSDEKQSLVENFYISTDNNPYLEHIANHASAKSEGIPFSGLYKGVEHQFYAGAVNDYIPWTLVVFHDNKELQFINMLVILVSTLMFLAIVAILLGLFKLFFRQLPWAGFGLYRKDKTSTYIPVFISTLVLILTQIFLTHLFTDILLLLIVWILSILIVFKIVGTIIISSRRIKRFTIRLGYFVAFVGVIRFLSLNINFSGGEYLYGFMSLMMMYGAYFCLMKYHFRKGTRVAEKVLKKDTFGYCLYICGLLVLIAAIPVIITVNANFSYHIDKISHIDNLRIKQQIATRTQDMKDYYTLIGLDPREPYLDRFFSKGINPENDDVLHSDVTNASSKRLLWTANASDNVGDGMLRSSDIKVPGLFRPHREPLLQAIYAGQSFNMDTTSLLSILARRNETNEKEYAQQADYLVQIYPGQLVRKAIVARAELLFFSVLICFFVLFYVIRYTVTSRLMGLEISDNFRARLVKQNSVSDLPKLLALLKEGRVRPAYAMIVRPERENIERLIIQNKENLISGGVVDLHSIISFYPANVKGDENSLKIDTKALDELKSQISKLESKKILVLKNLGAIAFEPHFRQQALQFIEYAMAVQNMSIIILADVSPLFKLTRQEAYPKIPIQDYAEPSETTRWSNLFSRFTKYYDWNPEKPKSLRVVPPIVDVSERESKSWPELATLNLAFHHFHYENKLNDLQKKQFLQPKDSASLDTLCANRAYYQTLQDYWTEEQVIEFYTEHAGAIYRYRWEICTKDERVLMYQLATGHIANPLAHEPLEHLIRRGYIVNCGRWILASKSFSNFVLSAETHDTYDRWLEESKESFWRYLRIPLFIMIFVLFGFIVYSATEAYESVIGLMTALLGLFPLLLRNFSLFKGGITPTIE